MKKILFIIFVIQLFLIAGDSKSQDIPKFGGLLKVGLKSDITTHFPWEIRDMETLMTMENVYETLVRLKKEVAETEPCLATEWKASNDYRVWTFNLRKNVKFHDGTIFNADSVIETLSLSKVLNAKMRKIDDYSVEFTLDKPNAAFAISLSIEYYGIASKSTVECFKNNCKEFIAKGTGPFIIEKWEPKKQIVLVANDNYWGGRPYLDKVNFIIYKDNQTALKAIVNKEIDILLGISPDNIEEVKKYKHLVFQSKPALGVGYIAFNTERLPFNNKNIRKAVSYAIDKKQLVNKYYYSGQIGIIANSCLPIAMFGFCKDIPETDYSIIKAKEMIAKEGYPNGFQTTILPPPVVRVTIPEPYKISEDITFQLAKVGIEAKIVKANSWKEYLDKAFSGNFDILLFGWVADTVDPNDFLTALFSKGTINFTNLSRWYNPNFEKVIDNARYANVSKRIDLYKQAQLILQEEMPVIPFVNAMQLGVWNERVKGYTLHQAARLYLQYIWVSQ